ncbi:MAG: GNAT family N-acetyltransferase [Firmicutes bacterium]|nr:GNAT family N-acetyltransferase [Bacillota bacterium]
MNHKTSYLNVVDTFKMNMNRYFYELEELLASPDEYQTYLLADDVIVLITALKNHHQDYLVRVLMDNYKNKTIDSILEFLAVQNINSFLLAINCLEEVDIHYLQRRNLVFRSVRKSFVKLKQLEEYSAKNVRELKKSDLALAQQTKFPEIKYRPSFEILFNIFVLQNKGRIFAYLEEEKIVGYLSFIKSFANYYDVDFIYVADEFRHRGIGTSLAKVYGNTVLNENMIPYWSYAINKESEHTALKAGFELCCKHWHFEG